MPSPSEILNQLTLVTGGHGSRTIPAVLALWSAFYAVVGIAILGVVLDVGLVVASFALVALAVQNGGTSTAATLSRVP